MRLSPPKPTPQPEERKEHRQAFTGGTHFQLCCKCPSHRLLVPAAVLTARLQQDSAYCRHTRPQPRQDGVEAGVDEQLPGIARHVITQVLERGPARGGADSVCFLKVGMDWHLSGINQLMPGSVGH